MQITETELFFKYIKDKHLERKNVSGEDLANALESAGFLEQVIGTSEWTWTDKAKSGEFKREFWKVVDSAKPNPQLRKLCRYHTFLCLIFLGIGAQDSLSFPLQSIHEVVAASQKHPWFFAKGSPMFQVLFLHPSQRSVS